jgi:broad specificity phosphatase PhoE
LRAAAAATTASAVARTLLLPVTGRAVVVALPRRRLREGLGRALSIPRGRARQLAGKLAGLSATSIFAGSMLAQVRVEEVRRVKGMTTQLPLHGVRKILR